MTAGNDVPASAVAWTHTELDVRVGNALVWHNQPRSPRSLGTLFRLWAEPSVLVVAWGSGAASS